MRPDEDNKDGSLVSVVSSGIREAHSSFDIPDGEQAWQHMRARLTREGNKKKRKRFQMAAAACLLAILVVASAGQQIYAIAKLSVIIKKAQDGVVHIIIGDELENTKGAKTAPPPEEPYPGAFNAPGSGITSPSCEPDSDGQWREGAPPKTERLENRHERVTLEEARKKFGDLLVPQQVPSGFEVSWVDLYPIPDGSYRMATILYTRPDSDYVLHYSYHQRSKARKTVMTIASFDPEAKTKEIQVNGSKGVLISDSKGFVHLEWFTEKADLSVLGPITEDEAMAMANSLH